MESDKNIYAPVIIPTLNRFDHFRKCIESLEHCTDADKTDVFVALDYPPSQKYVDGWKKIDTYLKEKERDNGFKQLHVIRREKNCGVGTTTSNGALLRDEVLKDYDVYIFSEDDNVFSDNFLVYCNKGLQKYKDQDNVYAICAYDWGENKTELKSEHYLTQRMCAWGVARWRSKFEVYQRDYVGLDNVAKLLKDRSSRNLIRKKSPESLYMMITMLKKGDFWGDAMMECYLRIKDMYNVFPAKSLVRNLGCDGSGFHGNGSYDKNTDSHYSTQDIDDRSGFCFSDYEYFIKAENVQSKKSSFKQMIANLIARIDLFLFVNFNFIPKSKYI